jgi:hypothetical protein
MYSALSYIRYSVQKRNEEKESAEIQCRMTGEPTKRSNWEILHELASRVWTDAERRKINHPLYFLEALV